MYLIKRIWIGKLQVFSDEGAVELSPALRQEFLDKTADFGSKSALRCLALALRQLPNGSRQVRAWPPCLRLRRSKI